MSSPILIEYTEAVGRHGAETVRAPILSAVSLLMVARGADRIVLPAPGEQTKARIGEAMEDLPLERRGMVHLADTSGAILRRVRSYLEPMRRQASKWPEDAFVSFVETFLYHAAVGERERATVLDDAVQTVREFIPIIDPSTFRDEALFRLADIVSLIVGYEPALADEATAIATADVGLTGRTVEEILHSSEFHALTATAGKLGLVRNPRVALKELRRRFERLIARKGVKQILGLAKTAAELSGAGQAAEATERVFDSMRGTASEAAFHPPFINLGPAQLGIYRAALNNRFPGAQPPEGKIMVFEHFRQDVVGISWLDAGDETKLEREAKAGITSRLKSAAEARTAYQRFLR